MLRPVILSGGSGTRLWPLSTPDLPKQFAPLLSGHSLFEQAIGRLARLTDVGRPYVITGDSHVELTRTAAVRAGVEPELIIIEPVGRNTAPAAIAAALASDEEDILVILPSDHLIRSEEVFCDLVGKAAGLAALGHILTFGVVPTRPETGYGYIERGEPVDGAFRVSRFKEKPEVSEAEGLIADGRHLWNSGIFVAPAGLVLSEASSHAPRLLEGVRAAMGRIDGDVMRLGIEFGEVPAISFDHAVMEHTSKAVVMPLDVGWDDVGSFAALWAVSDRDADDNALSGDVRTLDVHDSLIVAGSRRVAAVGVEGLVIVETPEAVLVVARNRSQEVKQLLGDAGET